MRISRKMEHIHHALSMRPQGRNGLGDVRLVPNALPDISLSTVSLATRIGELNLSSPIFINAMTGGSQETEAINGQLAVAAKETGLAMAVGSQMSAIKDKSVRDSYRVVRRLNPEGIILGNLGAEANVEQALEAVDMIAADGLQIHLNVMQELLMPEGERHFQGTTERISRIAEAVGVPVIVKEVGFGIVSEAAARLKSAGIHALDVSGSGGTSFAAIENARRNRPLSALNQWGCTTAAALLECAPAFGSGGMIASGGLKSGLEVVKTLTLGASAAGVAGFFLKLLQQSGVEGLIQGITEMKEEAALAMAALGAGRVEELWSCPVVIMGETAEWCRARGIDTDCLARRRRG
jgi:isopentenyl-diphosphate delta-isomerase